MVRALLNSPSLGRRRHLLARGRDFYAVLLLNTGQLTLVGGDLLVLDCRFRSGPDFHEICLRLTVDVVYRQGDGLL